MNTYENVQVSWQHQRDEGERAEREHFARMNHEELLVALAHAPRINPYFSLWYVMGETKNLTLFGWPLFLYVQREDIDALDRYHAGTNLGRLMGLPDDDQHMKRIIITREYPSKSAFQTLERMLVKQIGRSTVSLP
jgi:hypothetical protein